MTTTGKRFEMRAQRIRVGKKLKDIEREAGVNATNVSSIERGEYRWKLTLSKVRRLAPAYEVEPLEMVELVELTGCGVQPKAKKKLTEAAA